MHVRTTDDKGIDAVEISDEFGVILRIRTCIRYKTSHYSGDEYRTSAVIERPARPIDRENGDAENGWVCIDDRGYIGIREACMACFGAVMDNCQDLLEKTFVSFAFYAKKVRVAYDSYGAKPLAYVLGRLAWRHVIAGEEGSFVPLKNFCAQYGCSEVPTVFYRLNKEFYRGTRTEKELPEDPKRRSYRGFCSTHCKRGDCSLDDADENYTRVVWDGTKGHYVDYVEIPAAENKVAAKAGDDLE